MNEKKQYLYFKKNKQKKGKMEKGRTEAIFVLKNMLSGLRISKLLGVAEATVLKLYIVYQK